MKDDVGKKFIKQELKTRKTYICLCLVLPIFMFLNLTLAADWIQKGFFDKTIRQSPLGMGLWECLLFFYEIGLFIMFFGNKTLVNLNKYFFWTLGFLSSVAGKFVIGHSIWIAVEKIIENEPFYTLVELDAYKIRLYDIMDPSVLLALLINPIILVMFNICNWAEIPDDTKCEELHSWNFYVYAEWVHKCIVISIFMRLITFYAALLLTINIYIVPFGLVATIFGIVLIYLGFSVFKFDLNNKNTNVDKNLTATLIRH